jgi:hypothetical protein
MAALNQSLDDLSSSRIFEVKAGAKRRVRQQI